MKCIFIPHLRKYFCFEEEILKNIRDPYLLTFINKVKWEYEDLKQFVEDLKEEGIDVVYLNSVFCLKYLIKKELETIEKEEKRKERKEIYEIQKIIEEIKEKY